MHIICKLFSGAEIISTNDQSVIITLVKLTPTSRYLASNLNQLVHIKTITLIKGQCTHLGHCA